MYPLNSFEISLCEGRLELGFSSVAGSQRHNFVEGRFQRKMPTDIEAHLLQHMRLLTGRKVLGTFALHAPSLRLGLAPMFGRRSTSCATSHDRTVMVPGPMVPFSGTDPRCVELRIFFVQIFEESFFCYRTEL